MLEVGWSEMLVIAIVLIVVVGPKDLPRMLRSFGRTTAKMRQMAGDFQKQFNEALREAELDEVKKSVDTLRDLNPAGQIKKSLNPFEKAAADVRAGLQSLNPSSPAASEAQPAEPLKNGAAAIPAEAPPSAGAQPPLNPSPPQPAATEARPAEPLKTGPAAMPAASAPPAAVRPARKSKAAGEKPAGAARKKPAAKAKPTRTRA